MINPPQFQRYRALGTTLRVMKTHRILALIVPLSLACFMGCSTTSRFEPSGNPLLDLRNPELLERDRVRAAKAAWAEVQQGVRDRERTRYALKNLAWSSGTDAELRLVVIDLLMSDTSDEGNADSQNMARLLLPNERDPEVVRVIAYHAVEFGWSDLIPAFVRSLSRDQPGVLDQDRPEYIAIQRLGGGKPIEQEVFGVFLNPSAVAASEQETAVLRTDQRTRDEAWGLLGRLDPTGAFRAEFIAGVDLADPTLDPAARTLIEDLRIARDELGVIPDTSLEIAWLASLRSHSDERNRKANQLWWGEVQGAVNDLTDEQRAGLRLRNLEPVRWATLNQPGWVILDRQGLFSVLSARLRGRTVHKRKPEKGEQPRFERLGDWADDMTWGDLLSVLVVDDAIRSALVQEQVFTQRSLDRKDTTTEYGGVIEAGSDESWRAVLFRPRQRDRISDQRFVASDDMFRFSDRSLIHYHFHADKRNNARYAGPSLEDFLSARASQRTSVVFTSMSSDELDVDVYFGNGVVIDLGLIQGSAE